LIHDGKYYNEQVCYKRTFKHLHQVNRQQLPSLIMLIMPQAKTSLRMQMITEWPQPSTETVAAWGPQIGEGLLYLHQIIGMAHLNLKPENILLYPVEKHATPDPKQAPLHSRYVLKISDCACSLLLPTASKVLSLSHDTNIYVVSPPLAHKFGGKWEDSLHYDVHCYAMVLLLMLHGYPLFDRRFMLTQFPGGLLSMARYRLVEAIETSEHVPAPFVNLFRQVFGKAQPRVTSVQQVLKHQAFQTGQD